jgi:DNA replication initiation complex subunit (GINS family)
MDDEEINYITLRKIQQLEKNTPVLTDLKTDFYIDLSNYLKRLNKRVEGESDTQKKMLLEDEIQNTRKIALNIYEHREKKIMLAAVSKTRGGRPDEKNMLAVEKDLYERLIHYLQEIRSQIFEGKKSEKNSDLQKDSIEKQVEKKDEEIKEESKDETVSNKIYSNTNPVLLVNQDIPEFVGTDAKKYSLRKDDLLSTPKEMADMLCKRKAAEKIDFYSDSEIKK